LVYNPNIPLATDQLSVSQGQILQNFQALGPIATGLIDLPPQAANPTPTGDNIIFAKTYEVTTEEEVYIQNATSGINYPFTASEPIENQGWTFLPSGILLKWGLAAVTGGPNLISLAFGPVFALNPFIVQATVIPITSGVGLVNNSFIMVSDFLIAHFSAWGVQRTPNIGVATSTTFSWLAIGLGTGD
jgi:hypothetical protein